MKTSLMVIVYIACCIRIAAKPCKYFQLNVRHFDGKRGIFSKIAIDRMIPKPWRLAQVYDDDKMPRRFPVFLKPEWSQNARGVYRADNADELRRIRAQIADRQVHKQTRGAVAYLRQQAAMQKREYEIFSIPHHRESTRAAILTVTETHNRQRHPINSIHNPNTRYREITDSFSAAQRAKIWRIVRRIGQFNIARVSVRADSIADLLAEKFHVIEVNLFLPMPINLLDARQSRIAKLRFIMRAMMCLALVTKHRDKSIREQAVFIKSMRYNRRRPFHVVGDVVRNVWAGLWINRGRR